MVSLLALLLVLALQLLHCHSRRHSSPSRLFHTTTSAAADVAPPLVAPSAASRPMKKFFIETHGCQMNLADSDVIRSVLLSAGYELGESLESSDLILTNTCAIREGSEAKIHQRLKYFNSLKKKQRRAGGSGGPMVGVLGCMAERIKEALLEEDGVDFIAGPDNYRALPRIISFVSSTDQQESNTQLSLDETYSDIRPVREAEGKTHAFITIQRGCSNHCAFCIVPYVRGVERSRPVESILAEIRQLSSEGYKEVVLLGQNVNSYHDINSTSTLTSSAYATAEGFEQRSRPRNASSGGAGVRFAELLQRAAAVDPDMRVRFQSPHPKDFPDDVLRVIAATPNVCKALHMPAQHGSSAVLERMKRGYTREAYLSLVRRARLILGSDVGLSTDLISGFSGETEEEHRETLSLLSEVGYDQAFTYSYSRREQTYAGLFYEDDVPEDVKSRRLSEIIDLFQATAEANNNRLERGALHVVLVEGEGRKAGDTWTGRTDSNKRILFVDTPVLASPPSLEELLALRGMSVDGAAADADAYAARLRSAVDTMCGSATTAVQRGDYIIVKVLYGKGHTLRGVALARTSLREGAALMRAARDRV